MKVRPSVLAWTGLAGYVLIVDLFLIKKKKQKGYPYCSMSETFGEMLRHPVKRWPVTISWGFLTFHLFQPIFFKKGKDHE